MKKKSIKNKKILVAIGIVTVCTVLITAGILKLVNNSTTESSVESLEKSKISNLFNIRQAEGDEEESSSGRVTYRTSSSSENSTNSRNATEQSTTQRTTTKQTTSSKTPSSTTQSSSNSSQTTPSDGGTTQTPVTPSPSEKPNEPVTDNNTDQPIPPENTTTPDATSGYTITIDNAIKGHVYEAYQIFQGDLYEQPEADKKVLSNIKWGNAFEPYANEIISELKEKYALQGSYDNCKTAADVADILSQHEDHAKEFSIIIGKKIKYSGITTTHKTDSSKDDYKITGLEPGYYIVVDSQIPDKDDAYSRYFLNVVSNVIMEVKSIVPHLGKTVSGGAKIDETHNTETYYGEENEIYGLTFSLQAMIPTNQTKNAENNHFKEYLAEYTDYEYYIIDIIDKGFDLYKDENGKIAVTAKDEDGKPLEIDFSVEEINLTEANKSEYKLDDITSYAGKKVFKIAMRDLKTEVTNGKLNPGDIVTFEYKAKLNGNHNVGDVPNINEAYLIYSDNPHDSTSKSRTTENKTYTYSIDLELSKIAELKSQDDERTTLSNAIFEIYNDEKVKIATLTCGDEGDIKGYAKYTSLAAGKYYIKEYKAPDGYNKLNEEIELTIESAMENDTIKWNVSIKKTPEVNKLVHLTNEKTEENPDYNGTKVVEKDGVSYRSIFIEIENTSGATLPVTGGIGTIIFTIVGLSIMIIAVICLKSNKRK